MKQQPTQQFIATREAVFCLAFSPDGEQLAAGTGSFYGAGSLLLYPLRNDANLVKVAGEAQSLILSWQEPQPKNPQLLAKPERVSATALYFTPDSKQLWLASSASRRQQGPLFCFDLTAGLLQLPPALQLPGMADQYPDGFLQLGQQLFICCHSMDGCAKSHTYQADIDSFCAQPSHSSRLILLKGQLITPGSSRPALQHGMRPDPRRYTFGLSFASVRPHSSASKHGEAPITAATGFIAHQTNLTIPVRHAILAIAQDPNSDMFITGDSAGHLHRWWFNGQWQHQQIQPEKQPEVATRLDIADSIFAPDAIVALLYLPQNQGWLSLSANGLLIYWCDQQIRHCKQISELGSPRCMALHPTKPVLAIGLKHNAQLEGAGLILVDISTWLVTE